MSENLKIYNQVKSVPAEAKKTISGGRLNGFTDINPVWRIKTLTDLFGAVGFGWYYTIDKQWCEQGVDGEVSAFCNISLYVKQNNEWSMGVQGTGGAKLIEKSKNGLYNSDEAYKMALTDALSVACKSFGIGADVYWEKDSNKYDRPSEPKQEAPKPTETPSNEPKCEICGTAFKPFNWKDKDYTAQDAFNMSKKKNGKALCKKCATVE